MAAVAVTLLAGKAKIWWETLVAGGGSSWTIGVMSWSTFKAELEVSFCDPDRERKLISRF